MRRPTRILTLAAIAPLTALALAACTPSGPLPLLSSASPTPTPTATTAPGPTAAAIAALARREVGEGTVVAVEDESAGTEWDVRVVLEDGSEQELHLAADGVVVAGPSADPTDADEASANRALVAAASISLAAAHTRMLATVPGGRVTAIELDDDEDRVAWRGDVLLDGVRHDVRIDAVNGSVLLNRADADPSASPTPPTGS